MNLRNILVGVKSIGAYAPKNILTNKDFESMVDTTDEWITRRTGIKQRHIASNEEFTSDLAYNAGKIALERAGLEAKDLDAIIVATLSPDYFAMPSTACVVAKKLGVSDIMAFDISAACTGFIYLLEVARGLILSGKKNILIIGAEKISSILDYSDRSTCVLFGDGAGAAVVSVVEKNPIIDIHTASNGEYEDYLYTKRGQDFNNPIGLKLEMRGNEVFKVAVNTLANDVEDILKKNNIKPNDIDLFIPHQANLRIIKHVQEKLGFSDSQCALCVDKYGNTSAASIPMAMNDMYEQGRLKNGSLILLDAFGGGFTWGSALLYFDGK